MTDQIDVGGEIVDAELPGTHTHHENHELLQREAFIPVRAADTLPFPAIGMFSVELIGKY
jgi:hypothetical protein